MKSRYGDAPNVLFIAALVAIASAVFATGLLAIMEDGDLEAATGPDASFTSRMDSSDPSKRTYEFTWTGRNADNVIWSFGDGTDAVAGPVSTMGKIKHTYPKPGEYNVKAIGTNDLGSSDASGKVSIPKIYIVKFEIPENIKTTSVPRTQYVNEGEKAFFPATATAEGKLVGWYYNYTSGYYDRTEQFNFARPIYFDVTLTARENPSAVNVNFSSNGSVSVPYGTTTTPPANADINTRTEWHFRAYKTLTGSSGSYENVPFDFSNVITAPTTFYSSSSSIDSATITDQTGTKVTLKVVGKNVSSTAYVFWGDGSSEDQSYTKGSYNYDSNHSWTFTHTYDRTDQSYQIQAYIITDDVRSPSKYVRATLPYVLNFNVNGGEWGVIEVTASADGAVNIPSSQPVRQGYTFKGWSTSLNSSASYQPGDSFTIGSDRTLYAVWSKQYSPTAALNYDPNSGGATVTGMPVNSSRTITDNSSTSETTVSFSVSTQKPYRSGYSFGGWSLTPGGTAISKSSFDIRYGNTVTLYAIWNKQYTHTATLSYDPNSGGAAVAGMPSNSSTTFIDTSPVNNNSASFSVSTLKPYRSGYSFGGWSMTPNGPAFTSQSISVPYDKTVTLYAIWNKQYGHTATLVYDPNSGGATVTGMPSGHTATVTDNSSSINTSASFSVSTQKPVRTGYSFEGWSLTADGPTYASQTISVPYDKTVTLYAKWSKSYSHTATLIFDSNGTGKTPAQQSDVVVDKNAADSGSHRFNILAPTGIPSDYTFKGWNTKADGTGSTRSDYIDVPYGTTVTLYAQWQHINKYLVNFRPGTGPSGVSNMPSDTTAISEGEAGKATLYKIPATAPQSYRDTYKFLGWLCSDGKTYGPADTVSVTSDILLTAKWAPYVDCLLRFDDGAVGDISHNIPEEMKAKVVSGEMAKFAIPSNVPTLDVSADGDIFRFTGWQTENGTIYKPGDVIQVPSNTTLTAVWTKESPNSESPSLVYIAIAVAALAAIAVVALAVYMHRRP